VLARLERRCLWRAVGTTGDQATRDVYSFDPTDGRVRRPGLEAATVAGVILVAGGRQSSGIVSRHLYALTPRTGTS
jgi:hypothetical protein